MPRSGEDELRRRFGELVRARRVEAGLTQDALGARAGIGGKYVSEIERGTRDLPLSTVQCIVEDGLGFGLDLRFLDGATGRHASSRPALDPVVEALAREISALPRGTRDAVIAIVRAVVVLADPSSRLAGVPPRGPRRRRPPS